MRVFWVIVFFLTGLMEGCNGLLNLDRRGVSMYFCLAMLSFAASYILDRLRKIPGK